MIDGKLELTIKINELPEARTVENGWQAFEVNCDNRVFTFKVKPKIWKKLTQANEQYPQWVAAISATLPTPEQRRKPTQVEQASIQVFERKPKPPKE